MKYIDADKLLVKIKGLYREQGFDTGEAEGAYQIAIKDILVIITSLQQEQPDFPTIVEQPEVDLEKEFNNYIDSVEGVPRMYHSDEQIVWAKSIAKHFFELGLNARKEN